MSINNRAIAQKSARERESRTGTERGERARKEADLVIWIRAVTLSLAPKRRQLALFRSALLLLLVCSEAVLGSFEVEFFRLLAVLDLYMLLDVLDC